MTRLIDFRLYVITDRARCVPRPLVDVIHDACAAGVRAVQLREKDMPRKELKQLAEACLGVTRRHGALMFLNQHQPLEGIQVDGLHFPESTPALPEVADTLAGASTHSIESATAAAAAGADFVTFGPVYETPSKKQFGPPQGIDALAAICSAVDIPVFALGGVTPERVSECVAAGAHGVAVIGAIMESIDVVATVERFKDALGGAL